MDEQQSYQPNEDLQEFFQTPALVLGEDREVFDLLHDEVLRTMQPQDVFEDMLVSDLVTAFWEQRRIQDCAAEIINAAKREALVLVLCPLLFGDLTAAVDMAADFYSGDQDKRQKVVALLKRHGLTQKTVTARAALQMAQVLARFDAMIALRQKLRETIQDNLERSRKRRRKANRRDVQTDVASEQPSSAVMVH